MYYYKWRGFVLHPSIHTYIFCASYPVPGWWVRECLDVSSYRRVYILRPKYTESLHEILRGPHLTLPK